MRRLRAYRYLDGLRRNVGRYWSDSTQRTKFREFGAFALYSDQIAAGIIGDQVAIVADGLDSELPATPPVPPKPQPPSDETEDQEVYAATLEVWEANRDRVLEEWTAAHDERGPLEEAQAWLSSWAEAEQLTGTLIELERDSAVPLGDGVLEMQWDARLDRPTVTIHPPDAYHPVLEGVDDGRYPHKVHLAWAFLDANDDEYVRRITYELVESPAWSPPYGDGTTSEVRCIKSDGTWLLDDLGDRTIDDLSDAGAIWAETPDGEQLRELELPIDFIPIVHVPNGFASVEHFGESSIAAACQIIEELTQGDTDAALAASISGTPQVAVSGTAVDDDLELKPGGVWDLGQDGKMIPMDLSAALDSLGEYVLALQERAEQVVRVPAGIVGRELKTGAETGISRAIRNYPFEQNVDRLRLAREDKNRLILKFAQRIAIAAGESTDNKPERVVGARIVYGSNLPNDLGAAADTVVKLLDAGAISKGTGLALLEQAGLQVNDKTLELAAIRSEDPDGAVKVADATGSEAAGADWLGIDVSGTEPGQELEGFGPG